MADPKGGSAEAIELELALLMRENPDRGIGLIADVYEKRLDAVYPDKRKRDMVLAYAGGPVEGVARPIYDAVGDAYPALGGVQRTAALSALLKIMDRWNGAHFRDVPFIREPLLIADIAMLRREYWPGLVEGKRLVGRHPTIGSFMRETMNADGTFRRDAVDSDFIVGITALRKDTSPYAEEYAEVAQRGFLERVMMAAVQMRFGFDPTPERLEAGTRRLMEILPERLHGRIPALRRERQIEHLRALLR